MRQDEDFANDSQGILIYGAAKVLWGAVMYAGVTDFFDVITEQRKKGAYDLLEAANGQLTLLRHQQLLLLKCHKRRSRHLNPQDACLDEPQRRVRRRGRCLALPRRLL